MRQREQEELIGLYDQAEYLNEVSWPENKLTKGFKIEKLFEYPEESELKLIWCPGIVLKVIKKDNKLIRRTLDGTQSLLERGEQQSQLSC